MTDASINNREKTRVGDGTPGPGRPKGSPNRATADIRAALALLAERNVEKLEQWFAEIEDPARRCEIFLKLLEFNLPKLGRTEISADVGLRQYVAEIPAQLPTEQWLKARDEWLTAINLAPKTGHGPGVRQAVTNGP